MTLKTDAIFEAADGLLWGMDTVEWVTIYHIIENILFT